MPYVHIEPKQMNARSTMALVNKMRRLKKIADHTIFTINVNGCNDWEVTISVDEAFDDVVCWLNGHQNDYNFYRVDDSHTWRI